MTDSPERVADLPETPELAASGGRPPPPTKTKTSEDKVETYLGMLFPVGIGGLFILSNETSRDFIFQWWWAIGLVGLIALLAVTLFVGRHWLSETAATTRAALLIFVVLPLLLAAVGSVAVLPQAYQITALRAVFFLVVCLLPAIMWFLFLATRKASLLNEFLANLHRLGLLYPAGDEGEDSKNRRVQSYLQKFEAIYGDLPDTIHADVLGNRFTRYSRAETGGVITLSTTTVPVMLSTILIALGWLIALPVGDSVPTNGASSWVRALDPTVAPVTLAFLGAYFFSLQMLFRRYVLNDLGGTAYVAVSMRIILAVIGIWILVAVGKDGLFSTTQLLVAGFVFGVFPRVIWQIVGSIFKGVAKIVVPSMVSQLSVSDLDGLTVWHEARLEEEDVENIPNMATADLVDLLLNTRLPPERIIDWVDQAILYTQLGPQRKGDESARHKLRIHGIRTATSLLRAAAEVQRGGSRESFDRILSDGVAMRTLEASLATNSNLRLIQRWHGVSCRGPGPVDVRAAAEPPQREAA